MRSEAMLCTSKVVVPYMLSGTAQFASLRAAKKSRQGLHSAVGKSVGVIVDHRCCSNIYVFEQIDCMIFIDRMKG